MGGEDVGLVADIGRVSVRFGLSGGSAGLAPRDVQTFHTADHATFTSALAAYLKQAGMENRVLPSALAIAGAVRGDVVNMTGSRWYISLSGVEAVLRARPHAINECAANALALPELSDSAFQPLPGPRPKPVRPGGSFLVIGLGTGLGVAGLVTASGRLAVVQSEGGHMSFPVTTPEEAKVAEHLARRGGTAGNEALISAPGLVAIYEALSGGPAPAPEVITRDTARDPIAAATLTTFIGALGGMIGDLVLALGAWDGVYLSGAIARALLHKFADPALRRRMTAKEAFSRQLAEVPIAVINRDDLELLGAAAALQSR
ncbi:glucokinase [Hephaestia mangrovi]|uniref:glucokinase n=1 Tax=Hephaestia mangrovi TaxID=2873268 RepID=UPI001CA76820|nr:glucokinase [Hephaestia mangrovi]MBY8827469.1 glucokinase [Hephaestia mangrovi]